jgi:hypothetical protein
MLTLTSRLTVERAARPASALADIRCDLVAKFHIKPTTNRATPYQFDWVHRPSSLSDVVTERLSDLAGALHKFLFGGLARAHSWPAPLVGYEFRRLPYSLPCSLLLLLMRS